MTTRMPLSPVVDGARNAAPEWRQYLGAIEASITLLLRARVGSTVQRKVEELKGRIAALQTRIAALPEKAQNPHERLLMWRGQVINAGGAVSFNHELGTRHVFWQITDAGGNVVGGFDTQVDALNDGFVRLNLPAGTFDATIFGVLSDRY